MYKIIVYILLILFSVAFPIAALIVGSKCDNNYEQVNQEDKNKPAD